MQPLTRRYQPIHCRDLVGQDSAVRELKDFVTNFKKQKKKAVLLYGPSGVGKTCSIYALAHDLNYEVLEVNASDFRNKEQINSVVRNAIEQRSLFSRGKIILVDEVDGLSGDADRGGIQAITSLIEDSSYPLILTMTNPYDFKFSSLRSKCNPIKFEPLDYLSTFNILKKICEKEKIKFEEDALKALSRRAGGDARAAINDLQAIAEEGNITKNAVDELSQRNQIENMLSALTKVFKTTKADIAKDAFENVEEDIDERFLWVDENLPREYSGVDLARAYDMLSKADVYRGRIRRWQHWRFLVYIDALMTAGIATAKKEKNKATVEYKPTGRLLKIFWANQKNAKKKAIAAKIAKYTHCSKKKAYQTTLPYIKFIFENNKKMTEEIAEELRLEKEEVEWLKKFIPKKTP